MIISSCNNVELFIKIKELRNSGEIILFEDGRGEERTISGEHFMEGCASADSGRDSRGRRFYRVEPEVRD